MSENNMVAAKAEPATANASGEQVDTVSESTDLTLNVNERLLEESQKWKKSAQDERAARLEAQKQLESINKAKAEEQGRFKELYEAEVQARKRLQENLQKEKIEKAFHALAVQAGCKDTEAAFLMADQDLIQFDPNTGEVAGVETAFEDVKTRKGYLFESQPKASINPTVPGTTAVRPAQPDVRAQADKMSPAELKAQLAQLAKHAASQGVKI